MKKIVFAFLLVFALFNCSGGDGSKKQDDVNVNDSTQSGNTSYLGFWSIKDGSKSSLTEGDSKFVQVEGSGKFSNSTVINSPLNVVVAADSNNCYIAMNLSDGYAFSDKDPLIFNVQNQDGKVYKIKTVDGKVLKDDEFNSDSNFREILKQGGSISFSGDVFVQGSKNSYQFKIKDADYFQDALNKVTNNI